MAIIFRDANTVEVDGVNAGDIVSVIANYPTRKAEILKAFRNCRDSEQGELQAAKASEASEKATHETAVAKFTGDLAEQRKQDKAEADQQVADALRPVFAVAQKAIQERDELIIEFGGHEVVQAMKEQAMIEAKIKRKAELQAELVAMESE